MIDEGSFLRSLAASVAGTAMQSGTSICTAESCTGGMIAHLLTEVPGVSSVFLGGVVAYANSAKSEILGVNPNTLASFGAVSEPVARAMALGACEKLHAAVGVSTTGVAGPGGGSAAKPVGLVYIGVYGPGFDAVREFHFPGDRLEVIRAATREALNMLQRALTSRAN
jgi:nicotinamide-nucleotide amidase